MILAIKFLICGVLSHSDDFRDLHGLNRAVEANFSQNKSRSLVNRFIYLGGHSEKGFQRGSSRVGRQESTSVPLTMICSVRYAGLSGSSSDNRDRFQTKVLSRDPSDQ